ncbi:MAG: outer membrane beta-barrel protein [Anaerolineaceae bacterium]
MKKITPVFLLLPITLVLFLCSCSGYRSTVLPRVTIGEEYTDNLDLTHSNRQSDFISTVSPGITYALTRETKALTLAYDPSFAYYARGTDGGGDLATRHAAELTAWNQFARHSRVDFRDLYTMTDDPTSTLEPTFVRTDQPSPPIDTTIRRSRESYSTNFANAGFRHDFGRNDSVTLNYTHTILINDDPTIEDNTTNVPALGLTYWFSPRYGIDLRARYTRGDYSVQEGTPSDSINETFLSSRFLRRLSPHFDVFLQQILTDTDYDGDTPDYRIYDTTAGVDYHLSETVFFTLSGGYFYRTGDEGDPVSGHVLRGDMAKRFSRGSVRLSGGSGYDQAFFGAENLGFTKYDEAALAGTYEFSRLMVGEASASYRRSEYTDVEDREDTTITFLAGLTYRFRPWLFGAIRFTHNKVDSSLEVDSYDENRVILSVTMVPAEPYLLGR